MTVARHEPESPGPPRPSAEVASASALDGPERVSLSVRQAKRLTQ